MKKLIPILFAIILLQSCQTRSDKAQVKPETISFDLVELWATDTVLKTPESVYYDSERNVLYVANMNQVDEGENLGFISKLSTDGDILDLEWITGLIEPRGMGVYKGLLFVTDMSRIVVIETSTGEIKHATDVEGAGFLNDLAISPDGLVYFSDSKNGIIHTFKDNTPEIWLDEGLDRPNGLYIEKDRLLLASSGSSDVRAYKEAGSEYEVLAENIGRGDGIEFTGIDDYYLVTDWSGQIHIIGNDTIQTLLDTREKGMNTADLGYNPSSKTLYIPTFFNNRVIAYKLEERKE